MQLTEHFTLEEMVYSEKAIEKGIKNVPTQEVISCLTVLCREILEPLRIYLGKSIHINSGYRCPELNKAVGGAIDKKTGKPTSQHCFGMAADIIVAGMTPKQVCDTIDKLVKMGKIKPYDQLIEEFGANGWCHVSFTTKTTNRKMRFKIGC